MCFENIELCTYIELCIFFEKLCTMKVKELKKCVHFFWKIVYIECIKLCILNIQNYVKIFEKLSIKSIELCTFKKKKNYVHSLKKKIVYVKCIELCTFFENLCMLNDWIV